MQLLECGAQVGGAMPGLAAMRAARSLTRAKRAPDSLDGILNGLMLLKMEWYGVVDVFVLAFVCLKRISNRTGLKDGCK